MSTVSGRNFTIEVGNTIAIARVRRRPELDTNAGADDAKAMAAKILEIAVVVDALVLDLSDAPPVTGPRTQETLKSLMRTWIAGNRRVAVVIGPSAMQRLQIERLIDKVGSGACVVESLDVAKARLRSRP